MRRLLPLAAAALLVAVGYLTYVRARVSDAIQSAARREQLSIAFQTTGSWRPGSVGIRDLRVSAPEGAWRLELASADVSLSPVLGGQRPVQVTVPAQRAGFSWAGLRASAEIAGHAALPGLQSSELPQLRAASLVASHGVLRSETGVARGIELDLWLARAAESASVAGLRGNLALRGESAADLLRMLRASGVVQWLFPGALEAPFEARASVALDERSLRMDSIHARCDEVALRGHLTWTGSSPDGALLLTTDARSIGLRIAGGDVQPELAPGDNWLERQRLAPQRADVGLTSTAR
jgi:hypothetical protein